MKMHSDLGKMYRRNYMVKSQLRSLEEKSKALNAKIDGKTKIDEWAESYITRADAQIDDVSDYMNYRNLAGLSKGSGHIIQYTIYEHPPTGTPHQAQPAPQPAPRPAPPAPQPAQPAPPASSGKYETTLRFIASMPIELQVVFRRIHDRNDFANIDNRIGAYGDDTLMKDKFARGGPHELADGRDKWFRLSKKYCDDNRINHNKLNSLMEAWKNSTVKHVVQNAPTVNQVEAAIRQSKKPADRKEDWPEIMAIAEGASGGKGSSSQYDALFGGLAHVRRPVPSTRALPVPKLPIYGQQRQPAPPRFKPAADRDRDGAPDKDDKFPDNPDEWADSDGDGYGDNGTMDFGAISDKYPIVTIGNTFGFVGTAALAGLVFGIVTYNPNTSYGGTALVQVLTNRARAAAVPAAIFGGLALAAQGLFGAGQQTGWY